MKTPDHCDEILRSRVEATEVLGRERFVAKISDIDSEVEAITLEARLSELGIPHSIRSHADSAYDGLFQISMGWGCIEASSEYSAEIKGILAEIRTAAQQERVQGEAEEETWRRPNARLWVLVSVLLLAMILAYLVQRGAVYWG